MSWLAEANSFEINKGIFQLMTGIKLCPPCGRVRLSFENSSLDIWT